jgi:hypothetical protein
MTFPRDLSDRLCELEPQTPALRGKYEQALRNILQRKLSWTMKLFVGAVGAMSIGIAVFLAFVAATHPELPGPAQLGLVGGVIFALAWTALTAWTLYQGTMQVKLQPKWIAGLAWVFAVFLETLFLVLAPSASNPYLGTIALLAGLVILIGAGVQFLGTCIQQSELRTREALLRLEYRLAEIADDHINPKR